MHALYVRAGPWNWKSLDNTNSLADWRVLPGELLERKCDSCAATHKTIVYKRLTSPGKIDFKKLFLESWETAPAGGSNLLNTDFALYSKRDDAKVLSPSHAHAIHTKCPPSCPCTHTKANNGQIGPETLRNDQWTNKNKMAGNVVTWSKGTGA